MPASTDKQLWPPRVPTVLIVAGCLYVLSWFLPVMDGLPGWLAFCASLSPIWPFEGHQIVPWNFALMAVSSALTNVVFVLLFVDLATGRRLGRPLTVLLLAVATALDLYWLGFTGEDRADLRIGYYLWVCSFGILVVGACIPVRSNSSIRSPEPL